MGLNADEDSASELRGETSQSYSVDGRGALLEFGGNITVAVALASFGVVLIESPAMSMSGFARAVIRVVCFGGAGIWAGLSVGQFYARSLRDGVSKIGVLVLSILLLVIGVGAIFQVMSFSSARRIAEICERVKSKAGNNLKESPRCRYYYLTRDELESKFLGDKD